MSEQIPDPSNLEETSKTQKDRTMRFIFYVIILILLIIVGVYLLLSATAEVQTEQSIAATGTALQNETLDSNAAIQLTSVQGTANAELLSYIQSLEEATVQAQANNMNEAAAQPTATKKPNNNQKNQQNNKNNNAAPKATREQNNQAANATPANNRNNKKAPPTDTPDAP